MIPSLLAGALALAIILLLLFRGDSGSAKRLQDPPKPGRTNSADGARASDGKGPRPGACALCGTILAPGESMRSDILPGKVDMLMRIYGCPHCLGGEAGRALRVCPVCSSELGPGDHAIARYFERPGRKHVHILGCTICRKKQGR